MQLKAMSPASLFLYYHTLEFFLGNPRIFLCAAMIDLLVIAKEPSKETCAKQRQSKGKAKAKQRQSKGKARGKLQYIAQANKRQQFGG
jgi:hypothetical protein